MAARQWTLEQRQQQAEMIKQWRPWTYSTGAKTLLGKARSSQNAFKPCSVGNLLKEVRLLLRNHNQSIDAFT